MKRIFIQFVLSAGLILGVFIPVAVFASTNSDKTPPKLLSLHIASTNANPSIAKPGDKVTLSLTSNEKVTPIVLVETRTLFAKATNTGGNSWDASYTVDPRDPTGQVDYIVTLTDTSGNIFLCTSARLPFQIIPRCATTDGSSVTIVKNTDTQAPVIAPHTDVSVVGIASGAAVSYSLPTATDNVDSNVAVSCTPAPGSNFALGTTTVTCTARDAANNNATPTTFKVIVTLPSDTQPPVIAAHEDVSVLAAHKNTAANVTYTNPTATDNVDASVAVSCSPASGSSFAFGTTTVTCTAHDAAGNNATPTTFDVGVYFVSVPYTMATQADESALCGPDWRNCFTGGSSFVNIDLGLGSTLGQGTLKSVTVAKDESSPFVSQPWIAEIRCYTDSAYTNTCPDWLQPNIHNGSVSYVASEFTDSSTDNKHWTADFTDSSHEANFDGTFPVQFKPNYYYRLIISDNGWNIGAYGNAAQTLPYYQITGMTI